MEKKDKYYETRFSFLESRKILRPIITKYLQKFVGKDKKILDMWCWYGDFINNIKASEKYATDLNPESQEFLDKGIVFEPKNLIIDDFSKQWIDFDVVFASNLLEHFNDQELEILIKKIQYVLKDWWNLLLLQPNFYYMYREYFDDYTHKKIFTHNSLVDFLTSYGFTYVHMEKKFLPWSFKKNFLPIRLSKILLKIYFIFPFRMWGQMFLVFEKHNK